MIKQLLTSVIVKYHYLSVSGRSIICRSRNFDLFDNDKSARYFAQPRPMIVNYLHPVLGVFTLCKIALPKYNYGESNLKFHRN